MPSLFQGKSQIDSLARQSQFSVSFANLSSPFLPSESSGGSISGLLLNLLPDSSQEQPPRLYVRAAEWASLVIAILVLLKSYGGCLSTLGFLVRATNSDNTGR